MQDVLKVMDLGRCGYDAAWALQKQLHAAVVARPEDGGVLLLVEHPPVITIGRSGHESNVLVDEAALARQGVELRRVDRGGDVTYHGPGQLVAYPIITLAGARRDVHAYLRGLEAAVICVLADYGIAAGRITGLTGVWVGDEKVCAIGVAIRRWTTFHGLALNVAPDLAHFRLITPCGIADKGVTSLTRLTGRGIPLGEVAEKLVRHFADEFGFSQIERVPAPGSSP